MAHVEPTFKNIGSSCVRVEWAGIAAGDTAEPVQWAGDADRSVQVEGTFDGATITIEGSIDEVNFRTLSDPTGTGLTFTSGRIEAITEAVVMIRPSISGGTTVDVTVSLLLRSSR